MEMFRNDKNYCIKKQRLLNNFYIYVQIFEGTHAHHEEINGRFKLETKRSCRDEEYSI